MLKFREASYMNVHNLRRIYDNCPPHFEKVKFNLYVHEKEISDWLHENTEGRFWIGPIVEELNGRNDINYQVGFEMPSEASYFALMLEQFNPSQKW